METLAGLSEIAGRFDYFLLDQYGVLHDGTELYAGVPETLSQLKSSGKIVAIISNSGRRAIANIERLDRIGIPPELYDHFATSGEVAWQALADRTSGDLKNVDCCFLLTRRNDRSAIEGLDIAETDDPAEADVVILSGSDGDRHSLDHYRDLLRPAARRGTLCLCTNPDKIMLTPTGRHFGAGRIAEMYSELGGKVRWIGKPYPEIYRHTLAMLGNPDLDRCLVIGDSIEHDIAGAKAAGLASALVRTGILADRSVDDLQALFDEHEAHPDFLINRFGW